MDPQLIHGDPPLETRAGSPVRAGPWGLDTDTPAPRSRVFRLRQPAAAAAAAAATAATAAATASTWYKQHMVLRGYGIGSVTIAHEPEAWRTRPWHPGLELGWVWAWSLGLVAEGPDQPQSEERKASKVTSAAEDGVGPWRAWSDGVR